MTANNDSFTLAAEPPADPVPVMGVGSGVLLGSVILTLHNMKLDKNLEKKLREIGSNLDAKIKEADALMAEARSAMGFEYPDAMGILEYDRECNDHDFCPEDMGEDLVRYARNFSVPNADVSRAP